MSRYPLQETCLAVICGTPVLATIMVAIRIYSRRQRQMQLVWDDYLIIIATLLSLALIGPSFRYVKIWNIGLHIWEVPHDKWEPNFDENYPIVLSFNLLNIPILPLAKASIILLLLRVGSIIRSVRCALYAVLAFNFLACFIPWLFYLFMCPPRTGNTWTPTTFGGLHCAGRLTTGRVSIFITSANLLTDLLIFPIPIVIMRRAKSTDIKSRIMIVLLFASSLVVTAVSSTKIYLVYRDRLFVLSKPDWTYTIDYCLNHIENNVAIIVACFPLLRGIMAQRSSTAQSRCTEDITSSGRSNQSQIHTQTPPKIFPTHNIHSSSPTVLNNVALKSSQFGVNISTRHMPHDRGYIQEKDFEYMIELHNVYSDKK